MHDEQVQRWREGDAAASTVVRNGLRGIADVIVSTPPGLPGSDGLSRDPDRRRDVTAAVAREVMQRGGSTADELRALAVMVAARHVVLAVRGDNPTAAEDSHLPPQLVVSLAMAPDSLSGHAREVADRHVGECRACAAEVDMVRRVVKAVTAPKPVAPPDNGGGPPSQAASVSLVRGAPPVRSSAEAAAAAAVAAERERTDVRSAVHGDRVEVQPPARPRVAPTGGGPVRPPRGGRLDRPETVGAIQAFWPVLAILGVMVVMLLLRSRETAQESALPKVAAIADRTPPAPPLPDELPDHASSAAIDLERGQCSLAAARFKTSRMREPDDPRIAWYEAGAWICAGDGDAAVAALDAYQAAGGASSVDLLWYQAQAALLQGHRSEARERLVRLRPLADLDRLARIDAQLEALRGIDS